MTCKSKDIWKYIQKIFILRDVATCEFEVFGYDEFKEPIEFGRFDLLEHLWDYLKTIVKVTGLSLEDIVVIDYESDCFDSEDETESSLGDWLMRKVEELW